MGTGDKVVVDTRNGWATRGFFGRINYDFDGKYLVEVNGRYDGSSRFCKRQPLGILPFRFIGMEHSSREIHAEDGRLLVKP